MCSNLSFVLRYLSCLCSWIVLKSSKWWKLRFGEKNDSVKITICENYDTKSSDNIQYFGKKIPTPQPASWKSVPPKTGSRLRYLEDGYTREPVYGWQGFEIHSYVHMYTRVNSWAKCHETLSSGNMYIQSIFIDTVNKLFEEGCKSRVGTVYIDRYMCPLIGTCLNW